MAARDLARAHGTRRWPLGPRIPAPLAERAWVVAAVTVVAAVLVALGPWSEGARGVAALALLAAGAALHRALGKRMREPRGWLVVDDRGVRRVEGGKEARLAEWADGVGVTVLARADRSRLALALTTPRATRFVPVAVAGEDDRACAPTLLDRAATVAESDLRVDDGAAITATDAEAVLESIASRAPGALDRVLLVDAAGEAVVLERAELRVGARRIDLSSALEWRAFVFQELGSHAASLCQATWVRQGDAEVFFVAPMPADTAWLQAAPDVRLMQAPQGEPPPRELRRAIDHLFMLPLRRALDRAPRISRAPSAPSMQREGRA
jgi:hypothetical protein